MTAMIIHIIVGIIIIISQIKMVIIIVITNGLIDIKSHLKSKLMLMHLIINNVL